MYIVYFADYINRTKSKIRGRNTFSRITRPCFCFSLFCIHVYVNRSLVVNVYNKNISEGGSRGRGCWRGPSVRSAWAYRRAECGCRYVQAMPGQHTHTAGVWNQRRSPAPAERRQFHVRHSAPHFSRMTSERQGLGDLVTRHTGIRAKDRRRMHFNIIYWNALLTLFLSTYTPWDWLSKEVFENIKYDYWLNDL